MTREGQAGLRGFRSTAVRSTLSFPGDHVGSQRPYTCPALMESTGQAPVDAEQGTVVSTPTGHLGGGPPPFDFQNRISKKAS